MSDYTIGVDQSGGADKTAIVVRNVITGEMRSATPAFIFHMVDKAAEWEQVAQRLASRLELNLAQAEYPDGRPWPTAEDYIIDAGYSIPTVEERKLEEAVIEAVGRACEECLDMRHPDFIDPSVQAFCRDAVGCRFADARAALTAYREGRG